MIKNNIDLDLQKIILKANRAVYCNPAAPWSVYTKLYSLSTEMSEDFLNQFNFNNKRVATVGSSGDQVLTYALLGSKDITLMDANILTPLFLELKLAALKTLTLNEFISYFEQFNNKEFMSLKIYSKIRAQLDEKTMLFWDKMYDDEIHNKLFHFEREIRSLPRPPYLANEENYEKLRSIIDEVKINFFHAELSNFSNCIEGEYDLIDLSNIYTYVSKENYWTAIENLYPYLSIDGSFKLHYGDYNILNEFNFSDKPSFFVSHRNSDNLGFVLWQNDEYLYNLKHEKKHF